MPREQFSHFKGKKFTKCSNGLIFTPGPMEHEVMERIAGLAIEADKTVPLFMAEQLRSALISFAELKMPWAAPKREGTSLGQLMISLPPEVIAAQLRKIILGFVCDSATVYRGIKNNVNKLAEEAYRFAYPMIDLCGRDNPRLNVIPSCHTTIWLPVTLNSEDMETREEFKAAILELASDAQFIDTTKQDFITVSRYIAGFPYSSMSSAGVLTRMLRRAIKNGHRPFIFNTLPGAQGDAQN